MVSLNFQLRFVFFLELPFSREKGLQKPISKITVTVGMLVCELEDNILLDFHKSSHPTKTEFNNCFIIHSKYFEVLPSLPPRRLFSKLWSIKISRVRFRDSCQILSKNSYHRLSDLFCVFLHFFSSVLVKKLSHFFLG